MRNVEKWKTHRVQIEILTPVVINTGEVYEYGELFLENNQLLQININNMIKLMDYNTRLKYIDIATKGIKSRDSKYHKMAHEIVKETISKNPDKQRMMFARPLGVLDSGIKTLEKKPFQAIDKTCVKKLNDKPYIPGSSIKGSLRTAIIQSLINKQQIKKSDYVTNWNKYKKTNEFEAFVMRVPPKITEDPFKYIKVSDFEFDDVRAKSYIGEVLVSTKKEPLPVYTSMTDAFCLNNNKVTLTGSISISSNLNKVSSLSKFYNFTSIIEAFNDFYIENFNNKYGKLPIGPRDFMSKLISDNISESRGLFNLGKFSGIENITYNIKQDQSINSKIYNENINIEGGESFSLVENKYLPSYCIISEA